MSQPILELKNLNKSFGKISAIKDVNLKIYKGEVVVMMGPSGSGKSTLLRCINCIEKINSGEIWFMGENITNPQVDIFEIRKKIGVVFQHFNLFPHFSNIKNVTIGLTEVLKMPKEEAEIIAQKLLVRVGIGDKAKLDFPPTLLGLLHYL